MSRQGRISPPEDPRWEENTAVQPVGSGPCEWIQESLSASPRIAAGTRIGDFEVGGEIGQNGLGVILEARQISWDQKVVLKVLSPGLTESKDAAMRFREEAALAGRVVHSGIIPVLAAGAADGHEYYAMPFQSGPTLEEFLKGALGIRGEFFYLETALRFAELARAVEALHRSGVLHRDIMPSNIFMEGDRFVLGDFKLAMDLCAADLMGGLLQRPEEILRGEGLVRNPVYAAPEEFRKGCRLDPQLDVYSLGMVLYEVATGVLPFPRCSADCMARLKLVRKPQAPRRLNPEIPIGLEAVIRQAIDVNPLIRHASAGDLASDLDRFAARKRGMTRRHQPPGLSPGDGDEGPGEDDNPDLARIA